MPAKALIAWSSGKDPAWALHEMRRSGDDEVVGALTTVTKTYEPRTSMHGVREELFGPARCRGACADPGADPYPCANEVYEARMASALADAKAAGVTQ